MIKFCFEVRIGNSLAYKYAELTSFTMYKLIHRFIYDYKSILKLLLRHAQAPLKTL